MDISNLNIELGLPTNRKIGYGTTAKEERFPNQNVLIMEGFEIPQPGPDGKTPKISRKFTMSDTLAKNLEYYGKDFRKTDDFPHELVYFGHAKDENGRKQLFLINSTRTPNEVVRAESCRATQAHTFSNKGLYDALSEEYGIEEGDEAVFELTEMDPELTGGMPVALITPYQEPEQFENGPDNEAEVEPEQAPEQDPVTT